MKHNEEKEFKKNKFESLCNVMDRIDKIIDAELIKIIDQDLTIIYLRKILKEIDNQIYWRSNEVKDEHIAKARAKYKYEEIINAIDKLSE
jgi:hypothetical protein